MAKNSKKIIALTAAAGAVGAVAATLAAWRPFQVLCKR